MSTPQDTTHADQIEHHEDCPGGPTVHRQTPRRDLTVCASCGALVATPRVNPWDPRTQPDPDRRR